jgi:hypothetical protein
MSRQSFVWCASAALLLAGCSRQTPIQSASAQSPSPEPVERSATAQVASSQTQPAPSQTIETAYDPATAEAASRRTYAGPMIPAGTPLHVRLDESLGTKHDSAGERFYASLSDPIVVDGRTLLPVGTHFTGHVTESKPSGNVKGRAVLAVRLDAFEWHGRQYPIETSSFESVSHKKKGLRWIAGGGGIGAVIGGIAGGGAGALIGGAAGAGAGTAGSFASGKRQVNLGAETPLTFTLRKPVQL